MEEKLTMDDFKEELEASYKAAEESGAQDSEELDPVWATLQQYMDDKEVLNVKIGGVVNAGVIAYVDGVRGFIPASRLSLDHVDDLNEWLNKKIRVRVITVDPEKKRLVLSAREILRAEARAAEDEKKKAAFERKLREEKMKAEVIDVTLPGRERKMGHRHPNTIALEEVEKIFIGMGYEVVEGPEVEYDYYNFEALNIPANHPAKDEQDTFYINDKIVLRTQTSSVQVHEMEKGKLPIRMISPGRVFRSDDVDATHSPSFHQIEGLVIDKNITFADLKGTLEQFAKKLFGEDTKVKFRPHHFPFTEPSAEMDVTCFKCGGKGCRFCKGEGWIEILGCGMVHPHVFEMSGIDPEEYTGFAFGVGLERIALLKYEIDDMRLLYENDKRFLEQF